jgi:ribosomal protein S18 acetylase RimI-like enzyme
MSGEIKEPYKIKKSDIQKAGIVLTDAFQHDPIWKKMLKEANYDQKCAFFESSIRYGLKFGKVIASSQKLEGIAVCVSSDYADITIWRGIRSGSFSSTMKMGLKMGLKMKPIFEPLEADRRKNMMGKFYIYLLVIGVATEYQRQGFGVKLLRTVIEESQQVGIPIYLETTTEVNIKMYKRLGFKILSLTNLPIINLSQ